MQARCHAIAWLVCRRQFSPVFTILPLIAASPALHRGGEHMHVLHTFSPASSNIARHVAALSSCPSLRPAPCLLVAASSEFAAQLALVPCQHAVDWQCVTTCARKRVGIRHQINHACTLRSRVPFGSMHPFSRCLSVLVVVEERLLH